MSKYFLFMSVEDVAVKQYLDHAIFVLNPREKWPAHVTVAGPFSKRINFPRDLDYHRQIFVVGCGRFNNHGRHSVYLNVGTFDLAARMHKPDFPNAVPHLTIYDGKDETLADILYERLREARLFGSFVARRLEMVESGSQYSADFALSVNLALDQRTANLSYNQLVDLKIEDRVDIAISSLKTGLTREIPPVEVLNRRAILKDVERRGTK